LRLERQPADPLQSFECESSSVAPSRSLRLAHCGLPEPMMIMDLRGVLSNPPEKLRALFDRGDGGDRVVARRD
jgi:hypothetical protein